MTILHTFLNQRNERKTAFNKQSLEKVDNQLVLNISTERISSKLISTSLAGTLIEKLKELSHTVVCGQRTPYVYRKSSRCINKPDLLGDNLICCSKVAYKTVTNVSIK